MTPITRERIRVITIGLAAALAGCAARFVIQPFVGPAIPFITFFPAVIAGALWAGTRGGTTAAMVSLALAPLWMSASYGQLKLVDWLSLGFFAITCGIIVWAVRQGYWAKRQSAALDARLAESEARFRQMANTIPQLAWMASPDGWIFWYNQRWYDYTGKTPAQMEGWGWQSVHDPNEIERVVARWKESIDSGEPFDMTFPLRGSDGVFRPFLTRVMPLRSERGEIVVWFGTNTDVSEQRRLMVERERLLESERAARSASERANIIKDEFLATVSHELRTPLNAILGWTQLLRMTGDETSVAEGLETIERNARAQARIIEDLLEMSRVISGKTRLDRQPIDMHSVIDAAIEAVAPSAAEKDVRIVKDLEPSEPVDGDPARLQQVMWNLLANAIKFTPSGGRVEIILRRLHSHLEVAVSDSGQGIAPEFLPFVFDRFRQQEGATSRRHGGLGLGLSIVKNLVELHGGSVRAESEGVQKGAAFTVSLPLSKSSPHTVAIAAGGDGDVIGATTLAGLRIVVVDDEKDSLDLVRRLLEARAAEVFSAASADEALLLFEKRRPHVIVSDIGMPEKDGFEMVRELRAREGDGAHIPAVALTAFARAEDRARAIEAGYQRHLAKPVEASELVAAVASLAGRNGAERVG